MERVIVRVQRLDHIRNSSSGELNINKIWPLKVELGSRADCQYILSQAKWLKKKQAAARKYINQLLSRSEQESEGVASLL